MPVCVAALDAMVVEPEIQISHLKFQMNI